MKQGFEHDKPADLLQDLHEDHVHLVQEGPLSPEAAVVGAELDDQVANVRFDALALLIRQRAPPVFDHLLHDLCTMGETYIGNIAASFAQTATAMPDYPNKLRASSVNARVRSQRTTLVTGQNKRQTRREAALPKWRSVSAQPTRQRSILTYQQAKHLLRV